MELTEKEILIRLGARIRLYRVAKGLTLLDMEVDTGMGNGYLSLIENGGKKIQFYTLYRIAKALAIPLDELVKDL